MTDSDTFLAPQQPAPRRAKPLKSDQSTANQTQDNNLPVYVPPEWAERPSGSLTTLEVMLNGVLSKTVRLEELVADKTFASVGRGELCDIRLNLAGASRMHCFLQYGQSEEGKGWHIVDRNSTHGTFLNKHELVKDKYRLVKSGSVVQITKKKKVVQRTDTDAQRTSPEVTSEQKRVFKDPVAFLNNFCEQEGIPFEFDKNAKRVDGKNECSCSFQLPDDICSSGSGHFTGTASSALEAQKECARQVCEFLDANGFLSSSVAWQKDRRLEENDFYDEGEDTFYDRTGQLEQQRVKRIQRLKGGATEETKSLTHGETLTKVKELAEAKSAIEEQLRRISKPFADAGTEETEQPKASLSVRMELSKLKKKLAEVTKDLALMEKAEEISRPKSFVQKPKPVVSPVKPEKQRSPVPAAVEPVEDGHAGEEVQATTSAAPAQVEPSAPAVQPPAEPRHTLSDAGKAEKSTQKVGADGKKYGLLTRKEHRSQEQPQKQKRKAEELSEQDDYLEKRNKGEEAEKDREPVWLPPSGQSGDGRTSLNDKLGY